ncbi:4-hydroxythreonine-4-phosphate dehydrogenase PdxA [Xanthobacter sp. YC-JY1]|uniref:4-hydroxythreonine-4-phosphate dehydrogenase PdxA n=1 Tax=Xanthobacter sp. YC-JY1 TaxID=2419844 RepID=UPI001F0078E0|nr:4-hydroxythreonine-4-phosphate dehydrogenase PdxA [Xanthobacter sp. YC-JY1]UJX44055.1 4-hydroxythreonine-4-phosphate dehydrogenase PdxA [Xanthobacter sp. YC-JY1]
MPAASPLVLALGDPAGIGPDVALAAFLRRRGTEGGAETVPAFIVAGDPAALTARARLLNLDIPLVETTPEGAVAHFANALPVFAAGPTFTGRAGRPDASSAACVVASLEAALGLVTSGRAAALVTNPLAKSVMYEAGFPFPGHTEWLADRAAGPGRPAPHPVMMIWSEQLAVVPATIHVPYADVPALLSIDLLVETGRIVARDMARRFGIARPRLAFCGLNPHAGEEGTLGGEDEAIVRPAVEALKREGILATGPLPADTMFHPEARSRYDAAVGMYHDQVLIPAKTLAFHDGVNVTLGLPFIRTSPDHGTAFDIAGTGRANPSSLMAALRLARRLADAEAAARPASAPALARA